MKQCSICRARRPLRDFHRHKGHKDGRSSQCRECRAAIRRVDLVKNGDAIRRSDRLRYQNNEARRAYNINNAMARESTTEGKVRKLDRTHRWREKNPKRYRAHNALNNAVRDGKIEKTSCTRCGAGDKVHGHHEDYDEPLIVTWLCATCHGVEHRMAT